MKYRCEKCGSTELGEKREFYVCKICGAKYTEEDLQGEALLSLQQKEENRDAWDHALGRVPNRAVLEKLVGMEQELEKMQEKIDENAIVLGEKVAAAAFDADEKTAQTQSELQALRTAVEKVGVEVEKVGSKIDESRVWATELIEELCAPDLDVNDLVNCIGTRVEELFARSNADEDHAEILRHIGALVEALPSLETRLSAQDNEAIQTITECANIILRSLEKVEDNARARGEDVEKAIAEIKETIALVDSDVAAVKTGVDEANRKLDEICLHVTSLIDNLSAPDLSADSFAAILDEKLTSFLSPEDETNATEEILRKLGELAEAIPKLTQKIPDTDKDKERKVEAFEKSVSEAMTSVQDPQNAEIPVMDSCEILSHFVHKMNPPQYCAAYLVLRQATESYLRYICGGDLNEKNLIFCFPDLKNDRKRNIAYIVENSQNPEIQALSDTEKKTIEDVLNDVYGEASSYVHNNDITPKTSSAFQSCLDKMKSICALDAATNHIRLFDGMQHLLEVARDEGRITEQSLASKWRFFAKEQNAILKKIVEKQGRLPYNYDCSYDNFMANDIYFVGKGC